MHRLLIRQIRKHLSEVDTHSMTPFIDAVSNSYFDMERDAKFFDQILDKSLEEYESLVKELKSKNQELLDYIKDLESNMEEVRNGIHISENQQQIEFKLGQDSKLLLDIKQASTTSIKQFSSFEEKNENTNIPIVDKENNYKLALATVLSELIDLNLSESHDSDKKMFLELTIGGDKVMDSNTSTYSNELPENLHILVVDDNEVNQIVIQRYLKRLNATIESAMSGEEALEKVKSKAFNLIVMDIQMPGLDGYETARLIRKMEEDYYHNIPIIAVTASLLSEQEDMIFESGMNDFVLKPFHLEKFKRTIAKYISNEEPI